MPYLTKFFLTFVLLIQLTCATSGQVTDNFSDGNINSNPTWIGDTQMFIVNSQAQLQINGTPGTSGEIATIATQANLIGNISWKFWLKFQFSPSTQNFVRYYLISDKSNLKDSLNGYYLQLGGTSGNTDSISLYRQQGLNRIYMGSGRPSTVSKNSNTVWIEVVKSNTGEWTVYSDTAVNSTKVLEFTVSDNTFSSCKYTGLYCRYTSSNVKNIYFDSLQVSQIIDTFPPKVDSIKVLSSTQIKVYFSEILDSVTSKNNNNYIVNKSFGNPSMVNNIVNNNITTVIITFSSAFQPGVPYTLTFSGITDKNGNNIIPISIPFQFGNSPTPLILINEILADPSPRVALPDYEFIELYNPNPYRVNITNWQITDGSTIGIISGQNGNQFIESDSLIILCSPIAAPTFSSLGQVAVMNTFPSLNNNGDNLQLISDKSTLVHEVMYDISYYQGMAKGSGGWSLELINPYSNCGGSLNWAPSINANGGTPGKKNSVYNIQRDSIRPVITHFWYNNSSQITYTFSEPVYDFKGIDSIKITPSTSISGITWNSGMDTLNIEFSGVGLLNGIQYEIELKGIQDCEGNKGDCFHDFEYNNLKKPIHGDIIISEIYASPIANSPLPNCEWFELYNRSKYSINLNNIYLQGLKPIQLKSYILQPDSYIIVCSYANLVKLKPYGMVIGIDNFPILKNESDIITLTDSLGQLIHKVKYQSLWHKPSFKSKGGWSLEITDPDLFCTSHSNYVSSINNLGATPARKNSVTKNIIDSVAPVLLHICEINNNNIILKFNEEVDSISMLSVFNYSIDQGLNILGINSLNGERDYIKIEFNHNFITGKKYTLQILKIVDCIKNTKFDTSIVFWIPETMSIEDLVINEILFNPFPDSYDYIEIINRSGKIIYTKDLFIANGDNLNNPINLISIPTRVLFPGEYLLLTPSFENLGQHYLIKDIHTIQEIDDFPTFPDDEGNVILTYRQTEIIDQFQYSSNMHLPTLLNQEGVSLERINFNRKTQDRTNWQSASTVANYGTPGYINSQFATVQPGSARISFSNSVISPDGDGWNDFLHILYKMDESGYIGKFLIYSIDGILIANPGGVMNLGTEGTITWNGLSTDGKELKSGDYIFIFEYYNSKGKTHIWKDVITIARKIND